MIKVALIDDNANSLKTLNNICTSYFNNLKYLHHLDCFSNAKEFIAVENEYDIIFLDIELPDINGVDLAKIIRSKNINCCICFITNYNKYAIKSYEAHAFDFIEKPISEIRLRKTLDEIFAYFNFKILSKTKLVFNSYGENINLLVEDILYFEYFDKKENHFNRTTIVKTRNNEYPLKVKISHISEMLPCDFFCIPHKSFIVNFSNIASIKNNIITMCDGAVIPLSQKRASKFKTAFNDYIKKYLIG